MSARDRAQATQQGCGDLRAWSPQSGAGRPAPPTSMPTAAVMPPPARARRLPPPAVLRCSNSLPQAPPAAVTRPLRTSPSLTPEIAGAKWGQTLPSQQVCAAVVSPSSPPSRPEQLTRAPASLSQSAAHHASQINLAHAQGHMTSPALLLSPATPPPFVNPTIPLLNLSTSLPRRHFFLPRSHQQPSRSIPALSIKRDLTTLSSLHTSSSYL